MYNTKADPDELTNLASDHLSPNTLKSLREQTTAVVNGLAVHSIRDRAVALDRSPPGRFGGDWGESSDSEGFMRVFDGKSLKGWSGDRQYWSVKEGAITGVTDGTLKVNQFFTWTGCYHTEF